MGAVSSEDWVAKRSSHCVLRVNELENENGEMDNWEPEELAGSTKAAFKRALRELETIGEEGKLCASCGCALCGASETWNATRGICVSRCQAGLVPAALCHRD